MEQMSAKQLATILEACVLAHYAGEPMPIPVSVIQDCITELRKNPEDTPRRPMAGLTESDKLKADRIARAYPGQKIQAVKAFRDETRHGLRESKDAIDEAYRIIDGEKNVPF